MPPKCPGDKDTYINWNLALSLPHFAPTGRTPQSQDHSQWELVPQFLPTPPPLTKLPLTSTKAQGGCLIGQVALYAPPSGIVFCCYIACGRASVSPQPCHSEGICALIIFENRFVKILI